MRYYKVIDDGYVLSVGTGAGGAEITKEEYENIISAIRNRPSPEDGYDYRLKEDLGWDLVEVSPVEEDPDISDSEALAIILGGAV